MNSTGTEWLRSIRSGGFCESLLALSNRTGPWPEEPPFVGERPGKLEPGAAATAASIIFLGGYELLTARHSIPVARYLNILILLNGITSMMNHITHNVYFDFWDGASMILAVNLAAALWFETLVELVWPRWCSCCVSAGPPLRTVCIGCVWLLVCAVMTPLGMTRVAPFGGLLAIPGSFVLFFNLPILLMVLTAAAMLHCGMSHMIQPTGSHLVSTATSDEPAGLCEGDQKDSPAPASEWALLGAARVYLWVGVASYLFGFVCWNVVEQGCDAMPDGFRAIGHAIWHLGAAYGLHCLFCLLIFFRAVLDARRFDGRWRFRFRSSPSTLLRVWLCVLPVPEVLEPPLGMSV